MRVIGHELGQVIYVAPPEEVRPAHANSRPVVMRKIAERYNFSVIPDLGQPWEKLASDGLRFMDGQINLNGLPMGVSEFTIFNDGIVINCRKTDAAAAFLKDIIEWTESEFGLRRPSRPARIIYNSHIVIEFQKPLSKLIKSFSKFSEALSAAYSELYNFEYNIDIEKIALKHDPTRLPQSAVAQEFFIERRLNRGYGEERYMAGAPLPSDLHLALLEQFESLIG